jgi:Arc/MetJ-type ribon-helix-helix transcriptional regulator
MGKEALKKLPDKMTDSEKNKKKNDNKAKANPKLAAAKKEKNDACRDRRAASGSSKSFA